MINDIEVGRIKVKVVWGMFSLLCLLFLGGQVHSDTSGKMAVIVDRQGPTPGGVQVSHDGAYWQELTLGDSLGEGDWIKTSNDAASQATIAFDTQQLSTVTVQTNTTVRISQLRDQTGDNPDYALNMTNGDVCSMLDGLQPGDVFQVQTPTAVITARGTTFIVSYSAARGTDFEVYEGTVETQMVNPVTAAVHGVRVSVVAPEETGTVLDTEMMVRYRRDTAGMTGVTKISLDEERSDAGELLTAAVRSKFHTWNSDIRVVRHEIGTLKDAIRTAGPLASPSQVELYKQKKRWVESALERLRELRATNNSTLELPSKPWP